MNDLDRFKLLHGPYVAPRVVRGDNLFDVVRNASVRVGGYTNTIIPWPRVLKTGNASLIVTEELARAVRTESVLAITHHWGPNFVTVWKWRKALGVPQVNEGTARLYADYKPEKLPDEVAAVGRANAATPEHYARMSEARTGKRAHPHTAEVLRHYAGLRKKKSHREKIGKAGQRYWLKLMPRIPNELVRAVIEYRKLAPAPSRGVQWSRDEEALLGLGPDRLIAGVLGRTKASVMLHRQSCGIPSFRAGRMLIGLQGKLATGPEGVDMSNKQLAELFGIEMENE